MTSTSASAHGERLQTAAVAVRMTATRFRQQTRCSGLLWLLLVCSCASLLPAVASACTSSSDCNGAVCLLSSPSASAGSCSCSDNSYEADGRLSSAAASPSCSDTVSSLYPTYFLAHRVVLLLLWSGLCLLSLLCLRRLYRASKATSRTLPSLLLLLLVSLSKLAYNACDPLDAAGILPPLLSLLFLFIDDVALLAAYCLLFGLLRDLLLLSPLVSDSQYARLVHTAHMLHLGLASCLVLLSVLIAALWVGQLRPVYLALVVAFTAAFTVSVLSKLYRLAARDRKAVRRVSMASVSPMPLPVSAAAESKVSAVADKRPSPSLSPTTSQSAANGSSVTAASTSQPADSPHSSKLSASQQSGEEQSRKPLSSHMTDSTQSVRASHAALLPLGGAAGGEQTGRRQSTMVVAVEAGSKPIKTYSVDRVNVRRLLRLHALLALAFVVYYAALLSRVSTADSAASSFFSSSLSAVSVITVHLTKDALQWLWCVVIVATVWPSSLALQKASAKRERRATVNAAASAAGAAERASSGGREELSALVQQNPVVARSASGRRGSVDSQHAVNVGPAVEDDDEDDQSAAENSRARAIALMSSTAAFMQTLDSRSSLAFAVSASPTSAVLFVPPSAHPPPVQPLSLSDDPTALLEPPYVLPAEPQQLPFAPSNRGLTAVRHSLPAIQIDPIILARVMRTMTEPSTPTQEGSHGIHSPEAAGGSGAAAGGSSASVARLLPPDVGRGVLLLREAERDEAGGDRPAPLRQSSIDAAAAGGKRPLSASSRAARPASASRASFNSAVQSQSFTVPAAAAAGGSAGVVMGGGSFGGFEPEQERERSRFESVLKETISPRTTSSKGSRHRRIFAPTSAEMDQ